ncbi:hypothetical protein MN116_002496 [Schistosoma mekongi]|uniref:Uncharacterized protein n=1 Tax=Schistosoma mekongi TaxID=38744 RepID=A0AAE1ZKB4_SCHME|nr:hypothetical protein MN116_002496 [Schistosoma mekongi]
MSSVYMPKSSPTDKISIKLNVLSSNSEILKNESNSNSSSTCKLTTTIKDIELNKYSSALISNRKSLIRSDCKIQQNINDKCNFPLRDLNYFEKFANYNTTDNKNISSIDNNENTLYQINLPERHIFTASTASLIVHVPSLSYVSEDVDEVGSDNEYQQSNRYNIQHYNRICPICNILYTDLQQQFDDFNGKRFRSLSDISVNINDTTSNTTTNNNSNSNNIISNINTSRLWDILESFSANSPRNLCHFHHKLSVYYNNFRSIHSTSKITINLTNSLSLPCLSNLNETDTMMMMTTTTTTTTTATKGILSDENDMLTIDDYMKFHRNTSTTPSISIEYADNELSTSVNNTQEQIINAKFTGDTKSKCESWLKTWSNS